MKIAFSLIVKYNILVFIISLDCIGRKPFLESFHSFLNRKNGNFLSNYRSHHVDMSDTSFSLWCIKNFDFDELFPNYPSIFPQSSCELICIIFRLLKNASAIIKRNINWCVLNCIFRACLYLILIIFIRNQIINCKILRAISNHKELLNRRKWILVFNLVSDLF